MKLLKTSQISIFILFGIIIIFTSFLYISAKYDFNKEELDYNKNFNSNSALNNVETYVESCIERQTKNGLTYILMQNGYYKRGTADQFPNISTLMYIDFYEMDSRYYYFNLSSLDQAIQLYLYDTLPYCIAEISEVYPNLNLVISNETFDLNVSCNPSNLKIDLKLPIQINNGNQKFLINDYVYTLDEVPLELMESDVNFILKSLFDKVLEHQPQNHTNFSFGNFSEELNPIFERNDTNLIILINSANSTNASSPDFQFILTYLEPWQKLTTIFNIEDETLEEKNEN